MWVCWYVFSCRCSFRESAYSMVRRCRRRRTVMAATVRRGGGCSPVVSGSFYAVSLLRLFLAVGTV